LAMQVEDHPLDYYDFEGVIPAGNYGAGTVIVWDAGTYDPLESDDPSEAIRKGKIKFVLSGKKLHGMFTLVKMHGRNREENAWLLIKDHDDGVDPAWKVEDHERSIVSGRTLDEVAKHKGSRVWISNRHADGRPKSDEPERPKGPRAAAAATPARPTSKRETEAAPSSPKGKRERAPASKAKRPRPSRALPPLTSVHPMLATLVDKPFDSDDWVFEIKWDGFRALCAIDGDGKVTLVSRTGRDLLPQFPEMAALGEAFEAREAIVDGEVVALDDEGRSSFQRLQRRLARLGPDAAEKTGVALTYVVFDLLFEDGVDWRGRPLEERKARLRELVVPDAGLALYSQHVSSAGKALFALARKKGLEGILAKEARSEYVGRRSSAWLKIKAIQSQECVIGGWTEPAGSRENFGSLLLGLYEGDTLHYAGHVGTGFTRGVLAGIMKKLAPLEIAKRPFVEEPPKAKTKTHWVKPMLVAQVKFTEWTDDGVMRHPAFLGLRDDKAPKECVREPEKHAPSSKRSRAEPAASPASRKTKARAGRGRA
jgi:bifunctional non-homologous end joining protein LigD